jgi:hypothetical protein
MTQTVCFWPMLLKNSARPQIAQRISSTVLANRCFALGSVRESSLRRQRAKIAFQQHRAKREVPTGSEIV